MPEIDAALAQAINAYLLVRTEIEPADLCFVFGTRHGVPEFCDEIARLWHEDYAPRVHVSGGLTPGGSRTEAAVIRDGLVERGIPPERISVEERATNTGENVRFSLPILDREIGLGDISSLIAVGKLCTSRRYLMTLQRHWPEVRKMLLPVHYHAVPRDRWMDHDELHERIVGEWRRIGPYFERGFIAEVDLPGIEYRPGGAS
jgi:uncharacterized SAM-binding protein YcdF (DUF218 family)